MTPVLIDLHKSSEKLFFVTYFNTLEKKLRTVQIEEDQIKDYLVVLNKGNYTGINVFEVTIKTSLYKEEEIHHNLDI